MDNETKQIVSEADSLRHLIEHSGWEIARKKLLERIAILSSVDGLDTTDPNKLIIDIKANQKAAQMLITWLQDIEGTVAQALNNTSLLSSRSSYIQRD